MNEPINQVFQSGEPEPKALVAWEPTFSSGGGAAYTVTECYFETRGPIVTVSATLTPPER